MKLKDARKLTKDAQEALRLRSIKWVVHNGKIRTEVACLLGVSRVAVSGWVARYKRSGEEAILKKVCLKALTYKTVRQNILSHSLKPL